MSADGGALRVGFASLMDPDGEPVGFSLQMMQKDVDLGVARESRVSLLAGTAAGEGMTMAGRLCGADEDLAEMGDALRAIAAQSEREVSR